MINLEVVAMMKKLGRNELCGCGSGKKYKHCCWNKPFECDVDEDGNAHKRYRIVRH